MNPVFESRNPRSGSNRARGNRDRQAVESLDSTKSPRSLQVKRLRVLIGCTEATASTLATLAFGEAKR
jgi:hypothetical protein